MSGLANSIHRYICIVISSLDSTFVYIVMTVHINIDL